MVGISRPVVKHSFLVKQTEDIPGVLKKALLAGGQRSPRSGSGRSAEGYSQSGEEAALRLAGRGEHALV